MNIIQANNTGSPFKRKRWEEYYILRANGLLESVLTKESRHLDKSDILASDYEIEGAPRPQAFSMDAIYLVRGGYGLDQ